MKAKRRSVFEWRAVLLLADRKIIPFFPFFSLNSSEIKICSVIEVILVWWVDPCIILAIILKLLSWKALKLCLYFLDIPIWFISLLVFFCFESRCVLYLRKRIRKCLDCYLLYFITIESKAFRRMLWFMLLLALIKWWIELSVIISNTIFIDDSLHFFNKLSELLIEILRIIWVFRWGVIMDTSRVSWIVSISVSFACFRFSLSCLFLSYSSFTLECLENCLGCWEFDSKFTSCFFDCDFPWDDSLDELFTNFLRNNWVFFLLRTNIFLWFIHITTSTAMRTIAITWHALRIEFSILI